MYGAYGKLSPYFKSAGIYCVSEVIANIIKETDKAESAKRIFFGTLIDAFFMRRFHYIVDARGFRVYQKVLLEQLLVAPNVGLGFLVVSNNFTTNNWSQLYADDCKFWPAACFIGYRFIKTHHRFVYIGFASVIWNNWRIYYHSN